jgi:hypothetical protein
MKKGGLNLIFRVSRAIGAARRAFMAEFEKKPSPEIESREALARRFYDFGEALSAVMDSDGKQMLRDLGILLDADGSTPILHCVQSYVALDASIGMVLEEETKAFLAANPDLAEELRRTRVELRPYLREGKQL